MTTQQPGASASDWAHFQALGLTPDLLPVVSDLTAELSPKSKLSPANIGKVPSQFNRDGYVVGFPDWTEHVATDRSILRWLRDPRIGICLQTGKQSQVFCFDIDIGDGAISRQVRDYIELLIGPLPVRFRSNSGKMVLLFRMSGKHVKRVLETAHGNIERLGWGQEVMLVGTHPSGVKYEWEGGLPAEIPEISPAEFEAVWEGLKGKWAVKPEIVARTGLSRPTVERSPSAAIDDIAHFMIETGMARGWTKDGRLNIICPWKHEHTGDSGETETQYFPAGVGGYKTGNWRCMHAHCQGRTIQDVRDEIGFMDSEFDDLTAGTALTADGAAIVVVAPPNYARMRNGEVLASAGNLELALSRDDQCGMKIRWDGFKDEIVWASPGADSMDWRPFRDADYMRLRIKLEKPPSQGGLDFKPIGRELIRDAVHFVAMGSQMDSATVWAESLQWDGVERVATFYSEYFGAANNPYTRAVGMYTWSALAGRALVPGVKADMAIILKSEQGTIKTEGIKSMAPFVDAFGELDLSKTDDVLARQTRGKLVCEISELRGLNSRDHGAIKSWVSRTHEEWVPKFKEFTTKFPRRFICLGSTNEDEFLADSTGERRWLPMEVGRTRLERLKADCEQLWAEGVHIFKTMGGVQWAEAETLAKREHGRFKVQDSWSDIIESWLAEDEFGAPEGVRQGDKALKLHEVLQGAVGLKPGQIGRKDELRAAKVLRMLGYKNRVCRAGMTTFRGWVNDDRVEAARAARGDEEEIG
jgi:predicted P-loop ATPase